jgi:hypothetical protein
LIGWLHAAHRDQEEVTMKTQTARTDTMTLGPFLTLILNSRPVTKSAEDPSKVSGGTQILPLAILPREETAAETQTVEVRRRTLGPFMSLVLRLVEEKAAELRFAAEHNHSRQALCVRVAVG